MKLENVQVYGLEESMKACGFPMLKEDVSEERAKRLASCSIGSGHDCFLKGISVHADITAPQYWWLQWQRYHFCDIVSSQSKMHRITKMNLDKQSGPLVTPQAKKALQEVIDFYNNNECSFDMVLSNVPMGLELKARVTTNYLQLKSQYFQRNDHKSREWREYCDWILKLPDFKELVLDD